MKTSLLEIHFVTYTKIWKPVCYSEIHFVSDVKMWMGMNWPILLYTLSVFKIYSVDDESFEEKYNLRVGKNVNLNYCADIAWNHMDGMLFCV